MRYLLLLLIGLFFFTFIHAQQTNKRIKYSIFNPVPKDKMKEMQLDRPDVTESAYSVEAGHFQVESDLFKMVRNKSEDLSHTEMGYNVANLKLGLTERLDVQLVVATFVSRKTKEITSNKIIHKANGFDDITLRFKYNFWGNEGGKTALGALPYISFPTSTIDDNDHQFGVIFPFALELNKGWNFGTQVGINFLKEDKTRYTSEFIYSFTFGKSITEKWSAFTETYTVYSVFSKSAEVYFDGGILYSISPNLTLDAGFNYGINKGIDKVLFTGFSFRL